VSIQNGVEAGQVLCELPNIISVVLWRRRQNGGYMWTDLLHCKC